MVKGLDKYIHKTTSIYNNVFQYLKKKKKKKKNQFYACPNLHADETSAHLK